MLSEDEVVAETSMQITHIRQILHIRSEWRRIFVFDKIEWR